ncbi:unnamed protein product, partial [Tetraodon nigroviridis]
MALGVPVSAEILKSSLTTMERHIQRLENDIEHFPKTDDEKDKFVEKIHGFCKHSREQYEKLSMMHKNMQKLYEGLGNFFAFDPPLRQHGGLLRRPGQLPRSLHEREKQERQQKKKQLIDMNKEGDETGVMDSLMEALQSGAAFRDRRKRTPRNG